MHIQMENLIFSEGQPRKIEFLIFLPSSIILEAMKKKLATCSFPKYFYANSQDVKGGRNWTKLSMGHSGTFEADLFQMNTFICCSTLQFLHF